MGRIGALPRFHALVSPRHRSPVNSVLVALIITVAVTLLLGPGLDPTWSFALTAIGHVSDLEVISFRPEFEQYAWTFGGAAPVKRIRTPAVLEVYTEDCFAGRVRSEQDLVSQVCEFPYLNPQTGPFHIEGAEPGDTVAVHFVSIEPARSWAASTTVPLFGALTGTHLTALLQEI